MKRLKLHKLDDLNHFIQSCVVVLNRGVPPVMIKDLSERLASMYGKRDVVAIWNLLSEHPLLWKDGFSILLPINVRATFMYYRELSPKKRFKKLTKQIKEIDNA